MGLSFDTRASVIGQLGVAINARALASVPQSTSMALEPVHREIIARLIKLLAKERGALFPFLSHDTDVATNCKAEQAIWPSAVN